MDLWLSSWEFRSDIRAWNVHTIGNHVLPTAVEMWLAFSGGCSLGLLSQTGKLTELLGFIPRAQPQHPSPSALPPVPPACRCSTPLLWPPPILSGFTAQGPLPRDARPPSGLQSPPNSWDLSDSLAFFHSIQFNYVLKANVDKIMQRLYVCSGDGMSSMLLCPHHKLLWGTVFSVFP